MNSPDDHTDRLLGLCHNQRPQQQQSSLLPNIGGAMPPPEMQMQMLGGFSTTTTSAPDCQQPQRSLPVECDCVDLTTSDSSVAADPDDMNKLTSLLEFYNHDLDRVQMHLEGALRHTQTQQDLLRRKAHLEARRQVRISFVASFLFIPTGLCVMTQFYIMISFFCVYDDAFGKSK